MLLVLMRSGPSHSHAHSGLTILPSSTNRRFIDAFTFFPWSLVWLGCPRSQRIIQSSVHAHTYYHKHLLQALAAAAYIALHASNIWF
jgi:hypothetical protein